MKIIGVDGCMLVVTLRQDEWKIILKLIADNYKEEEE